MQGSYTDMTERFARKEKLEGREGLKKRSQEFRNKRRNRRQD